MVSVFSKTITLKKICRGLPVSAPTCKELGNHCHPHNKRKADQTENQRLLLKPSDN